ncbi:hypothetical protein [Loigolactobacillus bifermentans]|uniref:Uncharacterized protein n=1 Tax=Loigolactobacillus bifermentans DSM 20003 TaxID=1423726 RepID=A0A0R1GYB9_9LACO|nr:hypothetical protein [Loigolactobacillus bifermentans]KRK38984.1 hypothetical protein FC07_GL002700 [Loigolactobacillus bifermentans DSM 20003]QGG59131.1 hypothetical protein LB003_00900 [Loigolactobacillus bifermentans]
MLIDLTEFRQRLKAIGYPVFQNGPPTGTAYPYFVYTFTNQRKITAGGQHLAYLSEYQVSLFTSGTEADLKGFREAFVDVPYIDFVGQQGDENDSTITNFYTYLRVLADE